MGSHLGLKDFDKLFNNVTSTPIIVNRLLDNVEAERAEFDKKLFVTYTDTDLMDTIPKCPCGHTFGQHHLNKKGRGTVCRECKREVQATIDKPLEPLIWVQAPEGVRAMVNPMAWRHLSSFFSLANNSSQRFNIIKYLTNTDYRPNKKMHSRWMEAIEAMGIKRGLNYFYDNFDDIIAKLSSLQPFRATRDKRDQLKDIHEYINIYRKEIFANYLPVHNQTIMVIENTKFGTYMDTTLKTVIDAVRNFSGIDSEIKDYSVSQKENRASKFSEAMAEFGNDYEKSFIAGKPGLARKHMYATRAFFTFRAVINSLTEPHHHNEIHLPWALSVTLFRVHLLSKLYRRGFGYNDAEYFLNAYTHRYHKLLDELFEELLNESPHTLSPTVEASIQDGKLVPKLLDDGSIETRKYPPRHGIPCLFGRNPSMYRTSVQYMFITRVKKDPTIQSISYPITSVSGPNAKLIGLPASNRWSTSF